MTGSDESGGRAKLAVLHVADGTEEDENDTPSPTKVRVRV